MQIRDAKPAAIGTRDQFFLTFRGVRGSYPVPGDKTLRYGGNTSCVEIWVGGRLVILDAGSGLITLGNELASLSDLPKPFRVVLLLTHLHHDHIQGIPFFQPAYMGTTWLYIYGPHTAPVAFEQALHQTFVHPYFPVQFEDMKSTKFFDSIQEPEVLILDAGSEQPAKRHVFRQDFVEAKDPVIITAMKAYAHPNGGVNVYKVRFRGKTVVFATDVEGYSGGDARLIRFCQKADVLIHDTHYLYEEYVNPDHPTQGFGHSTVEQAAEVAAKAAVKKLFLFHHSPSHSDEIVEAKEQRAREIFPPSVASREGMTVELL